MNDKRVIEAAKNAVRVIVRRPHAYKFWEKYGEVPITGLAVLDAEGKFIDGVKLPSKDAVEKIVALLQK